MSLLREPLLHFVVLGGALFALHVALGGELTAAAEDTIVVDGATVAGLVAQHERREGRAPTDDETEAAVERWVADAALVAEARALGLDRGDQVVERRLAQKMEFLLGSEADPPTPTDADLAAHLAPSPPPRLRVQHRLFRADRPDPAADARAAADALNRGEAVVGDPFIHGLELVDDAAGLDARLGPGFSAALPTDDRWAVAPSRFGVHAVKVAERTTPSVPTVDANRPALERAWRDARRDALQRERTRALVQRYRVVRRDR